MRLLVGPCLPLQTRLSCADLTGSAICLYNNIKFMHISEFINAFLLLTSLVSWLLLCIQMDKCPLFDRLYMHVPHNRLIWLLYDCCCKYCLMIGLKNLPEDEKKSTQNYTVVARCRARHAGAYRRLPFLDFICVCERALSFLYLPIRLRITDKQRRDNLFFGWGKSSN